MENLCVQVEVKFVTSPRSANLATSLDRVSLTLGCDHPLSGDAHDFAHLPVPVGPDVTPRKLTVLVDYLAFQKNIGEVAIGRQPGILCAAVKVKVRQQCLALGGELTRQSLQIVSLARRAIRLAEGLHD